MPKPDAVIVMDRQSFQAHFDSDRLGRLNRLVTLQRPPRLDELDTGKARSRLARAEVLITSWGAPMLTAQRLAAAPALRAVFHCAGSVRPIVSDGVWRRGIRVTSAAQANAIPVAEYTVAAIIFAGKKAPFIAAEADPGFSTRGRHRFGQLSNYQRTVGLVGFSQVGRRVVDLLARLGSTRCLVADPHASADEVESAGASLLSLRDMLPRCEVLSLHAPELPSTAGMIGAAELALLPDHATVVNTARASLIDAEALTAQCRSGRLFAILDVTSPEPLPAQHPLLTTPNAFVTPHLAGSLGSEVLRLTDLALDELTRWLAGEPLRTEVTPQSFASSA
jgi:phosphoglycerate dehydrogenase-like enzyme